MKSTTSQCSFAKNGSCANATRVCEAGIKRDYFGRSINLRIVDRRQYIFTLSVNWS